MPPEGEARTPVGGVRNVVARWVVTGRLRLTSATQFGGLPDGPAELSLRRDPVDGRPLLTGETLAGALRGHLADRLGGYRSDEAPEVSTLFGAALSDGQEGDDAAATQSPLIVFDAFAKGDGQGSEIRDGVAIVPATGLAEENFLFDLEVLPAGTVFDLRLELLVPDPESEEHLVGLLATALAGLSAGDIAFGARRSRGLGACVGTGWRARRFDLAGSAGWTDWLCSDHLAPTEGLAEHTSPSAAFAAVVAGSAPVAFDDQRMRAVIELDVGFAGGLLVRSPGVGADAPDASHLMSGGRSVLPGTSLAGALRTRALKIARLLHREAGDRLVVDLFGPRGPKVDLAASRLRVWESRVEDGQRIRQARIRIDRLTQGVLKTGLFEEEVVRDGRIDLRMEVRWSVSADERGGQDADLGMMALLVKDLLTGGLPVGGAASVGRGVLTGTGSIAVHRGGGGQAVRLDPTPGEMTDDDLATVNCWITALRDAPMEKVS